MQHKLMVIPSSMLCLINGGGDSENSKTVTAKIDFHEEKDHSKDYVSARIAVKNPDFLDFAVNGDINASGGKTVGVEFTFTFD